MSVSVAGIEGPLVMSETTSTNVQKRKEKIIVWFLKEKLYLFSQVGNGMQLTV